VHATPCEHVAVPPVGRSPTKPVEKCMTGAAIELPVTVPSIMS
jgi:hypothetical protein